ncbi:hypothetical protein Vretimale_11534 [Volvox reticuliferus]|uniref:Stress-response A/B barrel domain-containing protein n=2 Tax=Volvox reticuliferus TaxID=1737510 RepID=A0A8J4GHL4_9CHLO|nr:hypothetical protein Vretifemale_14914 [Volvox reticuliferus]GIM07378.1 hypothetical protein Vretimale_11534 [Volvox reticuliferus]
MQAVAWPSSFEFSRAHRQYITSLKWHHMQRRVHSARLARPAPATARADTVPVWETLVVVNSSPDASQSAEEQQELLDTLWSLQYRTPGACCASAGPVVQSAARDRSAAARAVVYYRFSSQVQAERFVAGPVFAEAKARLLGTGNVSLALWKVLVPNDMEALFKRGPAFETGVDLVLVIQPTLPQQPPAMDVIVELMARLQRTALAANSVQVSCGVDVMSLDPQYMWMARFPQEECAQRFLRSPAVAELATDLDIGTAPSEPSRAGALALTSLALIEIGAVKQSRQSL